MPDIKWVGSHIEVAPPKRPKKITGTRFAAIMGLNKWTTPFATWCAITKTYEEPFEDTVYTKAGKVIEPKQASYMKKAYVMDNLKTPTDIYGEDYFSKTYGDFFRDTPVLGGMWDYLLYDEDGKPTTVLEMKTTKRAEDWGEDVPEYYAQQAALYAYLLGVDDVIMVCSFLEKGDYEHPENFIPSARNTITVPFKVSERYPDFGDRVKKAINWWAEHVETGISPDYDPKADADILKALRTNSLAPDTDINALLGEADDLLDAIAEAEEAVAEKQKRLDVIKKMLKEHAVNNFRDGDKKVSIQSARYAWSVSKSTSVKIDEAAMQADGVLDKYKNKLTTTYKIESKRL